MFLCSCKKKWCLLCIYKWSIVDDGTRRFSGPRLQLCCAVGYPTPFSPVWEAMGKSSGFSVSSKTSWQWYEAHNLSSVLLGHSHLPSKSRYRIYGDLPETRTFYV